MSEPGTPNNALAKAASSYLRTAMHQPIRWHEWGPEAFQRAQAEDKPILLDIGAVWCHWCHVMDRESYENPEVAALINENFIAIKVDRDERPDVDSRYQVAVQAMSGQGGWPLTAFLTPKGHPFFGGTYFPPQDHWGRPGFKRVLASIASAYKDKREDVMDSAESVMTAISHQEAFAGRSGDVDAKTIDAILQSAISQFDPNHGGFGDKPKFPHSSALDLVIDGFTRTRNEQLHSIFTTTLEKMATGGIYDQLAGGFHRYSVDEKWIVPHFEKMSYDNSELLKNYVHAYQATDDPLYAAVAKDIIRWVDEWLSDRENGGFYASQDADHSMEDDGDYFTWTLEETRAALDQEEFATTTLYYDIGEIGDMHHNPQKNVLYVKTGMDAVAAKVKKSTEEVLRLLAQARAKMYAERKKRPTPYIDKTIYVNWNAMLISAYLEAARVLDLPEAQRFALHSLDRMLSQGWDAGRGKMAHVLAYSDVAGEGRAIPGLLEDHAFMTIACLDAFESSGELRYFEAAQQIAQAMQKNFYDTTGGGFYDAEMQMHGLETLGALTARRKPLQDSPTPASNPVAAIALMRLHALTNEAALKERAEETLETFAGVVDHFGIFAATYGIALRHLIEPHTQIVVLGVDQTAKELYREAVKGYALGKSVLQIPFSVKAEHLPAGLAETLLPLPAFKEGRSCAIVCSGFACQPPVHDVEVLSALLIPRPR